LISEAGERCVEFVFIGEKKITYDVVIMAPTSPIHTYIISISFISLTHCVHASVSVVARQCYTTEVHSQ